MNLSFQSARLTYSPIQLSDAADVFAYASDEAVARFTSWEAHESIQNTEAFLHHVLSRHNETEGCIHVVLALRLKQSEAVIGTISLSQSSAKTAHIDYAISRKYWGQGLMTEAVESLVEWIFQKLPVISEIRSGCLELNTGSVRVLEKCGFTLQKTYVSQRGGKFRNTLMRTNEYAFYRNKC